MTMTKGGIVDADQSQKQAPTPTAQTVGGKDITVKYQGRPANNTFGKGAVAPESSTQSPYGVYSDPGDTSKK